MRREGRGTNIKDVFKNHAAHGVAETGRTGGKEREGGWGREGVRLY